MNTQYVREGDIQRIPISTTRERERERESLHDDSSSVLYPSGTVACIIVFVVLIHTWRMFIVGF